MRVIDLIERRADDLGDRTAIIVAGESIRFGDLIAMVKEATASTWAKLPPGRGLVLGGTSVERVVGLLAAMEADRVVHLCSTTTSRASEGRPSAHRLVEGERFGPIATEFVSASGRSGFACIVETSGTTGAPKLVVHDDRSLAANLVLTTSVEDELHGEVTPDAWLPGDAIERLANRSPRGLSFLSGMPLTSIAGVSMLFRAIAMGETFVISDTLEPADLWSSAIRHGVTNIGLPPYTAGRFASLALARSIERPQLLHLGIGGAFSDPALVAQLEERLGCFVTLGYGATELGGVAIMSRPWDSAEVRRGTIGRPLRGVDVRFREIDDRGSEMLVRTPSMARGVLEGGEFRELAEWFATGDVVESTASGEFIVKGRADYLISRGAHRIDPARIEACIERHPLVDRCGVVGVPAMMGGNHDIEAFVVLASSEEVVDLESVRWELRRHCIRGLPTHAVPRRIRFVLNIPLAADRSPNRSVLRRHRDFDSPRS